MNLDIESMKEDGIVKGDFEKAVKEGDADFIAHLANQYNFDMNQFPDGGHPLSLACKLGFLDVAKELVRWGADIHEKEEECPTPLIYAVQNGHSHVVQWLVENGVDIDYEHESMDNSGNWEWGGSALGEAIRHGHLDIAEYLIDHGADVDTRIIDGNEKTTYPICECLLAGNSYLFQKMAKKDMDVNVEFRDGDDPPKTLFEMAIRKQELLYVYALLHAGADINAPISTMDGVYPIELAAMLEDSALVSFFLEHGAELKKESVLDYTYVFESVSAIFPDVASMVIKALASQMNKSE